MVISVTPNIKNKIRAIIFLICPHLSANNEHLQYITSNFQNLIFFFFTYSFGMSLITECMYESKVLYLFQ
jgi:hypothetical protein